MKITNKKLTSIIQESLERIVFKESETDTNDAIADEEEEEVMDQMLNNYKQGFQERLKETVKEVLRTKDEKKAIELSKQGIDVELKTKDGERMFEVDQDTSTIEAIYLGKDTGQAYSALGRGLRVKLSNGEILETTDDELLGRYKLLQKAAQRIDRLDIKDLNRILKGRQWDLQY